MDHFPRNTILRNVGYRGSPQGRGVGMTVTEKLSEALRELVSYEVDRIIDENNDWFMELLDERIRKATMYVPDRELGGEA